MSYAHSSLLTATLTHANGRGIAGKTVEFQVWTSGWFFHKESTATTNALGRVRVTVKPIAGGRYRFRFAGDSKFESAERERTIKSAAIVKRYYLGSQFKRAFYLRDAHLAAGKHQFIVNYDARYAVMLGGRTVTGSSGKAGTSFVFKLGRSATYTLKMSLWIPPDAPSFRPPSVLVRVW